MKLSINEYVHRMIKTSVTRPAKQQLVIKKSGLPGAGKGLFTRQAIKKGSLVVEYKGVLTTWKKITDDTKFNGYVFYINRNNVVDAKRHYTAFGRYANDAKGPGRKSGIVNNAHYITRGKKVFIQATKNIAAGSEILVSYGKEYWDVIRFNHTTDKEKKKNTGSAKK